MRQVLQVDAEPDHRRLVADDVHAVEDARRQVAHVTHDALRPGVEVRRPPVRVHVRGQAVEDAHLVAGVEQRRDDGRPDEAGSAGHEDAAHQVVR